MHFTYLPKTKYAVHLNVNFNKGENICVNKQEEKEGLCYQGSQEHMDAYITLMITLSQCFNNDRGKLVWYSHTVKNLNHLFSYRHSLPKWYCQPWIQRSVNCFLMYLWHHNNMVKEIVGPIAVVTTDKEA